MARKLDTTLKVRVVHYRREGELITRTDATVRSAGTVVATVTLTGKKDEAFVLALLRTSPGQFRRREGWEIAAAFGLVG